MNLRTTPRLYQSRDHDLFPALDRVRLLYGCPHYYYIRVGRSRVTINVDAFFVPLETQNRLAQLYSDYTKWWFTKGNPARRYAPRMLFLSSFHDWVGLTVLREHAQWWIELLNQAAVFTYDPWKVNCANLKHNIAQDRESAVMQ